MVQTQAARLCGSGKGSDLKSAPVGWRGGGARLVTEDVLGVREESQKCF